MFNWMMQWSCLYVVLHLLGTCGFLWVLLFPPITQNMHVKIIGYPQLPLLWLRMGCVSVCQSLHSYSQQRLASGSCDPGMNCTSYFSTKHNCLLCLFIMILSSFFRCRSAWLTTSLRAFPVHTGDWWTMRWHRLSSPPTATCFTQEDITSLWDADGVI